MNIESAIAKREELLVEARKITQAIKILTSDSVPECAGTKMAISQYNKRLSAIDDEIRELAEQCKPKPIHVALPIDKTLTSDDFRKCINTLIDLYNNKSADATYVFVAE